MWFIQKWYKLSWVSVDKSNSDFGVELFVLFFHFFKKICERFVNLVKMWTRDKDMKASHKKIFDFCEIVFRCQELHDIVVRLEVDEVFFVLFWDLSFHVRVINFVRNVQKGCSFLNKIFFLHIYVRKVILETIPFDVHKADPWNHALNQY